MSAHFQKEIDLLKKKLLTLSVIAEESVEKAVRSLIRRDAALAKDIIAYDYEIDKKEVELEEDCLKVLALHQPVAIDLRFIVTVLKINNELERIADLAVNIAERTIFLSKHDEIHSKSYFSGMTEKVRKMLRDSLDSLIRMDISQAHLVLASDDEVDAMNRDMYIQVQQEIKSDPSQIESFMHLLSCSRHLERIADHATNIAEDVIYMIDGEIVRHKTEEFN